MDAREQAGNYQVFYAPVSSYKGSFQGSVRDPVLVALSERGLRIRVQDL